MAAAAALVLPIRAAAPKRLGALLLDAATSWEFFRRDLASELAGLGWKEGANLANDWRFADGDAARLPGLANELVGAGVDALLCRGTLATRALQQATRRIPIVTGVGDPLRYGFAASLPAPGGNVTGVSYAQTEMATKQIELLRELAPALRRLVLLMPATPAAFAAEIGAPVERVARSMGLQPEGVILADAADLQRQLRRLRAALPAGALGGFVFGRGPTLGLAELVQGLLDEQVPAVFDQRAYVDAGGLVSYRLFWDNQTRRTAVQLDKVLRGADPATIPFELPTRSELFVNARTARALGLRVPPALRVLADEVIE